MQHNNFHVKFQFQIEVAKSNYNPQLTNTLGLIIFLFFRLKIKCKQTRRYFCFLKTHVGLHYSFRHEIV